MSEFITAAIIGACIPLVIRSLWRFIFLDDKPSKPLERSELLDIMKTFQQVVDENSKRSDKNQLELFNRLTKLEYEVNDIRAIGEKQHRPNPLD